MIELILNSTGNKRKSSFHRYKSPFYRFNIYMLNYLPNFVFKVSIIEPTYFFKRKQI